MNGEQPFIIYTKRAFRNPSLIVAWNYSAGGLATRVLDFLDKQLGLGIFAEIKLAEFFSLNGVEIKDDVIQFPESRFYQCRAKNILIFESDVPSRDHYKFLNTVVDFAIDQCKVKELYTIGEIISATGHFSPRRTSAIVNEPKLKKKLVRYGIEININYHTPPGGMPTMNSFLLWVAQRRNVAGCNLWVDVPFYLAGAGDPKASRHVLGFLDRRFKLSLDFGELDREVDKLNKDMEELKRQKPEINRFVEMLERGIALSESEGEMLAREVAEFLQRSH